MRKTIPLIITILFFIVVANAYCKKQQTYGNLTCKFVKNYDGDTITVNIPDVHPIIGKHINVRINGIDTPELRGTTGKVKEKARTAKGWLKIFAREQKF